MIKKKILIGEDEKNISDMYKLAFEQKGFDVSTAYNGKEVIEKAKNEKPDLVLLDLNMPVKDGFQVLHDISQEVNVYNIFKNIPVIVLSNYNNPQDIEYCTRMGAQDYVVKTEWTPSRIVERINKALGDTK